MSAEKPALRIAIVTDVRKAHISADIDFDSFGGIHVTDDTTVDDARLKPKRAQSDGESVEQHSLPDQIAAAKFEAARAVAANPFAAIRRIKMKPPGANGE